ncbi:MAG: DNA repair protein RadA [Vicinamibacteria bacterium]|jgi:DNA repair protein RadA/Sms|nr:DNA repair protein RadA [Vicinamibacteria bacterium]
MSKTRSVFECQACGFSSSKWLGRCPDCGEWNSFVEEKVTATPAAAAGKSGPRQGVLGLETGGRPHLFDEVDGAEADRIPSGIGEFDRVLGGGIVPGSMVLIGGEPGIGKSTLLLQVAHLLARMGGPVLYASGEESERQIKLRGERLGVRGGALYLMGETALERIVEQVDAIRPAALVIDSVQTIYSTRLSSAPGSISQVREVATQLLFLAKGRGLTTFLIGHVTKEGNLAGPKSLEHIVDTVLYFEGERQQHHRIVRAVKNRFGAISELGVFEMTGSGLAPVPNASALFLGERLEGAPGSSVTATLEGTRPMLVEVQALVSPTSFGTPRRMTIGLDANRTALLLAVLEKRVGLQLLGEDVYASVVGGLDVPEPAVDLGVAVAVASSFRNRPVPARTVVFGEVGLGGEIRAAGQAALRVREAAQMGFTRCVLPERNLPANGATREAGIELCGVRTLEQALEAAFGEG